MSLITCERCGERFDTEREPVTPAQNTRRCSSCGHDHSAGTPTPPSVEPVAADGGGNPAAMIDGLADALDDGDGGTELHVHFHTDG